MKHASRIVALLVIVFTIFAAHDVYAQSVVVSDCGSDSELRTALLDMQSGTGGTITFSCGSSPITIVSTTLLGGVYTNVTIDGGGRVTLSGGNATHLFEVADTGSLTLKNLRITRALNASDGGAIYAVGALVIENATFETNQSSGGNGGAIWSSGPLTIRNSRFLNNEGQHGGAIWSGTADAVQISGSTFRENKATLFPANGGAMMLAGPAQASVQSSAFESNVSTYAAAIYQAGGATLFVGESSFLRNMAGYSGSAIYSAGTLEVERSLFFANESDQMGSGGAIGSSSVLTVTNTTIASTVGPGIEASGSVTILNSTIANGRSRGFQGGYGILSGSSNITIKNTILTANQPNCQIYGSAVLDSQGFNISSDDTCALTATGDMVSTDPMLNGLGNFGGPTHSMQPLPGSPAIDNGQCDVTNKIDQRGIGRPARDACDIGSVELGWTNWLAWVDK